MLGRRQALAKRRLEFPVDSKDSRIGLLIRQAPRFPELGLEGAW